MPSREPFDALFGKKKIVIGMVHLGALPGAPRYAGNLNAVIDKALADANTLEQGAVDGIMIENFFDAPFFKDRVPRNRRQHDARRHYAASKYPAAARRQRSAERRHQ